jgi:hypothetical protein
VTRLSYPARCGGQSQGPATCTAVGETIVRACSATALVSVMPVAAAKVREASGTLPTPSDRDDAAHDS